ncbi:MAG: DUF1249 domain-containing protein [Candidatus Pelagadaptatus aseana]|uniref:DUF1249 domain-containing protein n=1 Tax=Candidatus Pelagadaptatus aseana TaxID=3120508 RepID=UPI0039B2598C
MQVTASRQATTRPYKVNLREQMACCEANYARLLKLMPDFDGRDQWHYQTRIGEASLNLSLTITERAPYTTMLSVQQCSGVSDWCVPPQMQVRLYHDVRMAEVIAWREHIRLQPRYEYPNHAMYQQDEKAQFNRYLADCLMQVIEYGHLPVQDFTIPDSVKSDPMRYKVGSNAAKGPTE